MFKTANSFDRGLFRFWAKRVLNYSMLLFRSHSRDPPPLSHEGVEVLGGSTLRSFRSINPIFREHISSVQDKLTF